MYVVGLLLRNLFQSVKVPSYLLCTHNMVTIITAAEKNLESLRVTRQYQLDRAHEDKEASSPVFDFTVLNSVHKDLGPSGRNIWRGRGHSKVGE